MQKLDHFKLINTTWVCADRARLELARFKVKKVVGVPGPRAGNHLSLVVSSETFDVFRGFFYRFLHSFYSSIYCGLHARGPCEWAGRAPSGPWVLDLSQYFSEKKKTLVLSLDLSLFNSFNIGSRPVRQMVSSEVPALQMRCDPSNALVNDPILKSLHNHWKLRQFVEFRV